MSALPEGGALPAKDWAQRHRAILVILCGAGDVLLAVAAHRLAACLRAEDTVARFGGDEFALLIEEIETEADAVVVAERIADSFRDPVLLEGREVFVGASVGIVISPPRLGDGADSLLRNADLAMYRAKATGRGRHVVFDATMQRGAVERLEELRSLGIRIAIDDFGTGYSSLGYLRRLPVDTLKIDRSFVNALGADPQTTAIVRSVVALAKSLQLSVTGEGIETAAQQAQLTQLGCDRGQGYLFSRPVSAADLSAILETAASAAQHQAAA